MELWFLPLFGACRSFCEFNRICICYNLHVDVLILLIRVVLLILGFCFMNKLGHIHINLHVHKPAIHITIICVFIIFCFQVFVFSGFG